MVDLAVVIVTWNVRELVLTAIGSLLDDIADSGLTADVYVVDSASSDETAEAVRDAHPQVNLTASKENLGFGRANNLALKQIGFDGSKPESRLPKAVYLLNPDTVIHKGATRALYDALFDDANTGLTGAQLFYEDGDFQHGAFMFPGLKQLWTEFFPTPGRFIVGSFNGRYPRELYARNQVFPVDFTLGATMMLRREVILQTGMFDEAFFMYCEEIDWAWRIHKAGWDVKCVPSAHVTHLVGRSTSQVRARSLINLWESRIRLYDKHHPRWKSMLAHWMIRLGMNRKLQQLRQNTSLHPDERASLQDAYQTIRDMT